MLKQLRSVSRFGDTGARGSRGPAECGVRDAPFAISAAHVLCDPPQTVKPRGTERFSDRSQKPCRASNTRELCRGRAAKSTPKAQIPRGDSGAVPGPGYSGPPPASPRRNAGRRAAVLPDVLPVPLKERHQTLHHVGVPAADVLRFAEVRVQIIELRRVPAGPRDLRLRPASSVLHPPSTGPVVVIGLMPPQDNCVALENHEAA